MRTIIDGFAQYERALIRARTRAALAVKKARQATGRRGALWVSTLSGRPPYRAFGRGAAGSLHRFRAMRSTGLTIRAIAERLNAAATPARGARLAPKEPSIACCNAARWPGKLDMANEELSRYGSRATCLTAPTSSSRSSRRTMLCARSASPARAVLRQALLEGNGGAGAPLRQAWGAQMNRSTRTQRGGKRKDAVRDSPRLVLSVPNWVQGNPVRFGDLLFATKAPLRAFGFTALPKGKPARWTRSRPASRPAQAARKRQHQECVGEFRCAKCLRGIFRRFDRYVPEDTSTAHPSVPDRENAAV